MTQSWTTPAAAKSAPNERHYQLPDDSDLEIIVVCTDPTNGFFAAQELFAARQDLTAILRKWPLRACSTESSEPTVPVDGQMIQNGVVAMGGPPFVQRAMGVLPWQFHFDVTPGRNDLIATDNSSLVVIRRDQPITQAFTEPAIDLSADGTQAASVAFSVANLEADETVMISDVSLYTANGTFADMTGTSASVPAFPNGCRSRIA